MLNQNEINQLAEHLFKHLEKSIDDGEPADTIPAQQWSETLDNVITLTSMSQNVDMITGEPGEFRLVMGDKTIYVCAEENSDGTVTITNRKQ